MSDSLFRAIPSVEKVLRSLGPLVVPRRAATAVVRSELATLRTDESSTVMDFDAVLARVRSALRQLGAGRIQLVINGTGVLLHTNLGRAPLAQKAIDTLHAAAANYTNLEYDLITGGRGSRALYLENNLALLCHAQAATVVNNCAAALVLMLRHFTRGPKKEVIISRGELIQIGGGFRIPEILEASGAHLREVGTTNQTNLADYSSAIGSDTALILKVHRSNFHQSGFTSNPDPAALAALARKQRVPFAEDLGSGAVMAMEKHAPIEHERTPAEAIRDGVDLVCFSGDKLFGGPQAGLIVGRARRVAALKREPFFRALRCDKLILAALEATVDIYLDGNEKQIPVLEMLRTTKEMLSRRAEAIAYALIDLPLSARIGEVRSRLGGGAMPRASVASVAVNLRPTNGLSLADFAARLRLGRPPVIGVISGDRFRLDLRTVFPSQDEALVRAVRIVLGTP